MNASAAVFATGDHAGIGSFLCGQIPRVRTMRWPLDCSASICRLRKGETHSIAVRQLMDATATLRPAPPPMQIAAVRDQATRAAKPTRIAWREVLGGFQFAIAISTKEQLLLPEEPLLAVLRWIVQEMPHRKR
jgi:hypothetical protein